MDATFDQQAAHRQFSVQCFNTTWDLIDKSNRTPADDATMLVRSAASLWHWTQRDDCNGRNLSIGYWQMSRVLTLMGQASLARQFAALSLDSAPAEDAFCRGYAYEALARAAAMTKDQLELVRCVDQARALAELVQDEQDRDVLLADLKTIER